MSWLLLLAALGLAVWLVRRESPSAGDSPQLAPVRFVPPGPSLLVTLDVAELMRSAKSELAELGAERLLGLRERCGFEPMLGLRRVAFAMPAAPATGNSDFALIADTSFEPEQLVRCAESVMRDRGGQPRRAQAGGFLTLGDSKGPGEIGVRSDGLFVLSGGGYFREVLDQAAGTLPAMPEARLRDQLHSQVRERLSPAQLILTLLADARFSLPGVRVLGLSLEVRDRLRLRGFVGCESDGACTQALRFIQAARDDLAREHGLEELRGLSITLRPQQLDLRGDLPRQALAPLLQQLL